MKGIFIVLVAAVLACGCGNRKAAGETGPQNEVTLPECLKIKIKSFEDKDPNDKPKFIMRYSYKGKTVWYIPSFCCDVPAEVIDGSCNVICQPEGGITGQGDGKCPDFKHEAKDGKMVWEQGE